MTLKLLTLKKGIHALFTLGCFYTHWLNCQWTNAQNESVGGFYHHSREIKI